MKAKITAKKALSIMLALLLIFSGMTTAASAADEKTCPHLESLGTDGWTVIKKPTCSSSGIMQKWCNDCDDYATKTIPNTQNENHVPGVWVEVVQHTCQTEGIRQIKCTECLAVIKTETVPAHDYSVIYGEEANCMRDGYEFSMCTTCFEMKTTTYPRVESAHNYGEWQIKKEATCLVESGIKTRNCLNRDKEGNYCTASESINFSDENNHVNVEWFDDQAVKATCTEDGYTPGVCHDCEAELTKVRPMHSDSEYEVLSTVPSTCHDHGSEYRRCLGNTVNGEWVPCGLEYTVELELDEDNHVYTEWRVSAEPGCKDGERYRVCIYNYNDKEVQKIPATGEHRYGDWVVTQEPTCSLRGEREKTCLDCDDKITETLPVKHDYAKWTTVKTVSCDESNLQQGTKYAECDKCNTKTYFTVPAVHTFGDWRIVTKADCKNNKAGTMERTCTGCKKTETKEYYAEHDFSIWFVTDEPICATEKSNGKTGTYTRVCKTCNKREQKLIPVTHEFVDVEIIGYPECALNEKGEPTNGEKIVECKFCGKTEKVVLEAEHNFTDWETVAKPSCKKTENGFEFVAGSKKRTCKACGYVETEVINGEHSFTNWVLPEGAKCGDEGVFTLTRSCTVCTETDEDTVSVLDHPNIKTIRTEPTCSTSGYTKKICVDCGAEELVGEITPPLGHDLDANWTTKVQPSCNTAGSRYKACSRCDYLEFEEISRVKHMLVELEPGTAATCIAPGTSAKTYCAVCHEVFDSKTVEPLGHSFAEGSEICSRCGVYKESNNCACSCHSTGGMEAIIFGIINKLYQFFGINQFCSCGELHYDEPGFFAKLFGKG